MVKSLIATSLLLLQLFSTTELGELFKLPALVQHYFEHESEHDHESIFQFLKEHYAELHATQNWLHAGHHKQLPFKATDHGYLVITFSIVPKIYSGTESLTFFTRQAVITLKDSSPHSYFLSDIWQPPRA